MFIFFGISISYDILSKIGILRNAVFALFTASGTIGLREQKKTKEEEEISRIIAKIQGEHISSLSESQQIKNQTHTQIKQEHDCCYETAYSTRVSSRKIGHQDLK